MDIASAQGIEIDDGVSDELTGRMKGDVAAATDLEEFDPEFAQTRLADSEICAVRAATEGDHGRMFEQEKSIRRSPSEPVGHRLMLERECVRVGRLAQPFDRERLAHPTPRRRLQIKIGRLEQFPNSMQETVRRGTIDGTMIVGKRHVHHGPNHDRVLPLERSHDGPFGDLAHAKNSDLRLIDDRETVEIPVATRVGDRKGPPPQIIRGELLVSGPTRKIMNGQRGPRQRKSVGISNHGNDETLLGLGRHTDVHILFLDDAVLDDGRIQSRVFTKGSNRGVNHEGKKGESDAVCLLERLLVLAAQSNDAAQVEFGNAGGAGVRGVAV
jgi:hypothetical protein